MNARKWLAGRLIAIARWLDPKGEAYLKVMLDIYMDAMINGTTVVKISPDEMYWKS